MYDTGADVSVISNTLFQKLKNKPKLTKHLGNLNSAGNTKLGVLGYCNLNLKVLGKNFDQKVFVCENLNQEAILGIDAIQKLGLNYNIRKRTFFFDENVNLISSHSVAALSTISPERFEPLTMRKMTLTTLTNTGQRPPPGQTGIVKIQSADYPSLFSSEGLVTTNRLREVS